jgi:SAM-dependent methyltransferase
MSTASFFKEQEIFFVKLSKKIFNLIPQFAKDIVDPENYSVRKFMIFAANNITKDSLLLDAGAGDCRYKKHFQHVRYESCDFADVFDKSSKGIHTFTCDLEDIPREDNHYDAIINTQVLEHVPNPEKVLKELYRVLKTGGKLFLTAPQGWGVHGAPYHFFNFTNFGLKLLFERAGYEIVFIKPRGGYFWYLSKRLSTLPFNIFSQYATTYSTKGRKLNIGIPFFIAFPIYLIVLIPFKLLSALFFLLDWLDKKQDYTLGYACYCIKK